MLNRPDGKKKAYVRLTSDFDALDIANKVRVSLSVGVKRGLMDGYAGPTRTVHADWLHLIYNVVHVVSSVVYVTMRKHT